MAHITTLTKAHSANTGVANTFSYSGSFDVFLETEVIVKLDGAALTYQSGTINESASPREYTVDISAKTIHVGGADLSSGTLEIYPNTSMGSPTARATFTPGSNVDSADLNNNQIQILRKLMEHGEQKLSKSGGTMTGDLTMGEDTTLIFEGATDDGYETTLTVADPTADRTITLPNVTGTVVTTGDTGTVATAMIADDAVDNDKLANSVVASIAANTSKTSNVTHTGEVTGSTTLTIAADAVDGSNIADDSIDSEHYVDGSIDLAHLSSASVDSTKMTAATVVTASEQAEATANDTSFFTTSASDARYFNISSGDTIKDGAAFPDNDTTIATTAAINDRIVDLVDDVGGFVPIANELAFPNANPDVNNGTGTLVSIKTLSTNYTSSGSGVISVANGTVGNSTVTINGAENSTTYNSGFGMIVETTAVLNTYTFHRLVPKATEVTTVAGSISNVNTVAGSIANVNTAAGGIANINTTAGAISNVNATGGSIANVNTVASNLSNVNNFAELYQIDDFSPSAPTTDGGGNSVAEGDLAYDSTANRLKVYTGSAWETGVEGSSALLSKSGGQMTGNITMSGSQTVDGRDLSADGTKLDGIEASADVTDATNVNAAGAIMHSDLGTKGQIVVGDGSGDATILAVGSNTHVLTADSGEASGVKWAATATGTPEGTAILSTGETGGTKFLREDGDNSCSWQSVPAGVTQENVEDWGGGLVTGNTETGITVTYQDGDGTLDFEVASQTPEGTAILSTGETGTAKFLRVDGDNSCSWQVPPDTNTQLSTEEVQDIVGGMVSGNTETGITVTYQDADGTIDFAVGTLNQDTSGTAAIATTVTVADESSDTTCFPLFVTTATGDQAPKSGSNLTFNSDTGALGATSFTGDGANLTNLPTSIGDIIEHKATMTGNHTIGSGNNGLVAGPFSTGSYTLTIPSGSVFTVV